MIEGVDLPAEAADEDEPTTVPEGTRAGRTDEAAASPQGAAASGPSGPAGASGPAGSTASASSGTPGASAASGPAGTTVGCGVARRPGRPRDARADEVILDAAAQVLAECGPGGFTVDAVAGKAGVGKATIYRRWPSRADLMLETAKQAGMGITDPDTGSVRDDMVHVLSMLARKLNDSVAGRLMPALIAEASINPEMSRTLAVFIDERRRMSQYIVQRAVDRGELPADTDVDQVVDMGAGPIFYRTLVARHPVEPDEVAALVDAILRSAGLDPDS
jgi:AcrR family transcriptional regulator